MTNSQNKLYSIKNLRKSRQREQGYTLLIRSLDIGYGDKIAITGPSGCGKSTTLDVLGLALQPDSADKFIFAPNGGAKGEELDIMTLWQKSRLDSLATLRLSRMGYVLQSGELLPFLNVEENILLPAMLSGISKEDARDSGRQLALMLGIENLWQAMPSTLSVGERQRVAIVRALTPHPEVILADEPTAALDPLHAEKVMEAFLNALDKFSGTLILVTHNTQWAIEGGLSQVSFQMIASNTGVTAVLDDVSHNHPGKYHEPVS